MDSCSTDKDGLNSGSAVNAGLLHATVACSVLQTSWSWKRVTIRWPSLRTGALKQQGAAHV